MLQFKRKISVSRVKKVGFMGAKEPGVFTSTSTSTQETAECVN